MGHVLTCVKAGVSQGREGTLRGHEQLDGGAGGQRAQGPACCPNVTQKPRFASQRSRGFPLPRLQAPPGPEPAATHCTALHPGDVEIIGDSVLISTRPLTLKSQTAP